MGYDTNRAGLVAGNEENHLKPIIDMFRTAKAAGAKYPKFSLPCPATGSVVVLRFAGAKSQQPGTVTVTDDGRYPDQKFYGRVNHAGEFVASRHPSAIRVRDFVAKFAADPAGFAKAHGDLVGNCMFCSKDLTVQDSIARGYGPVCASKYGLPKGGLTIDRNYEVTK